jgi:O-methyltransferase domain
MIAACDRGPIRTPVFTRIAESGRLLQEQCTGGDFSQTVPAGADAYILRWIIHDWSEVQAVVLLGKIREGMKPGARLMLLEELIPETPDLVPGKWIDVLMLAITGGRERTQKEYSELLSAANFELEDVVPTTGPLSILIAKARYTV